MTSRFAKLMWPGLVILVTKSMGQLSLDQEGYCNIHQNHTLCLFQDSVSDTCGQVVERGLSQDEKVLVTRLHNERRSFIARGLELRGDPGPQPPAANMMQLTYDEELGIEAQAWADQCIRNHECPNCRRLPRFSVGQNLFWYGHFVGSWEKSVKGWYDEVADFNSSFVFPFYVIPGVLVGHFTQMTWSQTTKVGCGKLFAQQQGKRFGQQFFICNYGLAGNLIKSEMYKVGEPCSQCPPGTSCSDEFPGLCKGVPLTPLTVRPPVREHIDFPGQPSRPPRPETTIVMPPIIIAEPEPDRNDSCVYTCKGNLGCSVRFNAATTSFSGSVVGSCFPPDFGGECSGTPDKCLDCVQGCAGRRGVTLTVEIDVDGRAGDPVESALSEPNFNADQDDSANDETSCSYNCQKTGGCSVRINSNRFISGSVLGSCFSDFFGGECSGTPAGCRKCNEICVSGHDQDEVIVLPAES